MTPHHVLVNVDLYDSLIMILLLIHGRCYEEVIQSILIEICGTNHCPKICTNLQIDNNYLIVIHIPDQTSIFIS